jgi:hypothetical protein
VQDGPSLHRLRFSKIKWKQLLRGRLLSGIDPGYSCKEGRRRTPIRIPL